MALPNLSQIQQALDAMLPKLKPIDLPTGTYGYFHSVPDGWLECNGAAVSRTTYADLFKVIGTKYGAGDGSKTFNLPDMNGRVLQATTNHSEVGQMKEASLPNIIGSFSLGQHYSGRYAPYVDGSTFSRKESLDNAASYNGNDAVKVEMNLGKANSTYTGTKFQPAAGLALLCIKF